MICGIWFIPFWIWIPFIGFILFIIGIVFKIVSIIIRNKEKNYPEINIDNFSQNSVGSNDNIEDRKD